MRTNDEDFASVRVWLDGELNAAAVDPDSPRAAALAAFLFSDIQATEKGARFYLKWLDDAISGKCAGEGGSGNAFTVSIDRDGVLIENEYLEELNSFRYSHEEYRTALEQVLAVMLESKINKLSSGSVSSLD